MLFWELWITMMMRCDAMYKYKWSPKFTASARRAIWSLAPCRLIPVFLVLVVCQVFVGLTCTVICPVISFVNLPELPLRPPPLWGSGQAPRENICVCYWSKSKITSNFSVRVDIFRFREMLVSSHPGVINSDFPPPGPFTGFHCSRTP